MPAAFESQGCIGEWSLHHFDMLVMKRADQIGAPIAAIEIYWSRLLSLTLQRNMTQPINNFRPMTLYAGPVGPIATDDTSWHHNKKRRQSEPPGVTDEKGAVVVVVVVVVVAVVAAVIVSVSVVVIVIIIVSGAVLLCC